MVDRTVIGWDTETFLITQENLAPKIVCLSMSLPDGDGDSLLGNDDPEKLDDTVRDILRSTFIFAGQNVGYDLTVLAANFPQYLTAIFDALQAERFSCTMIREKLLSLTETGQIDFERLPSGVTVKKSYSLAGIVQYYFNVDISASKDASDAWRTNYNVFDGVPVAEWPEDARQYAMDDAAWARKIWHMQETRRQNMIQRRGIDPFATEGFRVFVDFCLKLMAARGVATDPAKVAETEAMYAAMLTPDKLDLLIREGILIPATPPRPHKNAKEHVEGCKGTKKDPCACPPRMTAGTEESISQTRLREYVLALSSVIPEIKPKYTAPTEKFPKGQLQVNADFLDDYADMDPVLTQYKHRQDIQKMVTTELPRMKLNGTVAAVVHPQYDCLKATGRTSSFSSKSDSYASFNCQNVDPRARGCFVPRPGYLLFSIDYSQMELGTLAQTCYSLFGYSVLRDKINAGVDVHAYTGARLALANEPRLTPYLSGIRTVTPENVFQVFAALKGGDDTAQGIYKKWRKFAKPVNLGYPGGLGPKTFVRYAKGQGVLVNEEEAALFRELWKQTYPEMVDYFKHINTACIDRYNKGWDEDEKEEYDLYSYTTPFGLHRAGCDYCAAANGLGLQSPSAEGALTALLALVRSCYDPAMGSVLGPDRYGLTVSPIMFIHDEFVGEVRDDDRATERLEEIRRLMIESMRLVTPDVVVNATPCLMRRWDKDAKPVYVDGKLVPWTSDGKDA